MYFEDKASAMLLLNIKYDNSLKISRQAKN